MGVHHRHLRDDLQNSPGARFIDEIRRKCDVIVTVSSYHSADDGGSGLSLGRSADFYAGRCRSGAEGTSHAEACPIIAFDQRNIGSLPSMRWADENQIGRTSSKGVQEGKSHLSMQRMRLSKNLCNEAELTRDPMSTGPKLAQRGGLLCSGRSPRSVSRCSLSCMRRVNSLCGSGCAKYSRPYCALSTWPIFV
jgi:hypothetical protein